MRAVLSLNLKRVPNVRVVEAQDAREALEKMKENPPALILTDINMPEMSGFELIEAIRVKQADKSTPIIFITTRGEDSDRDRGLALGANAYISKPINGAQLVEAVEALLK